MKKDLTIIFCILSVFSVFAVVCLYGCSDVYKNVRIVNGDASGLINEDFYADNYIRGAYYNGSEFDDPDYPESRTFMINDSEQLNSVFSSNTDLEIDFQKETLIVYSYTAINHRDLSIKKASVSDGILKLELKTKNSFRPDTCVPYQRYVVIRINGTDIQNVEIIIE